MVLNTEHNTCSDWENNIAALVNIHGHQIHDNVTLLSLMVIKKKAEWTTR